MKKFKVKVNGQSYEVEVQEMGAAEGSATGAVQSERKPRPLPHVATETEIPKAAGRSTPGPRNFKEVVAPLPGTVMEIKVSPGQELITGQPLFILEAMKMENEIQAAGAGKVKDIKVKKGQSVTTGEVLALLE
jgi:glutaconyl-CoA decarboxylase